MAGRLGRSAGLKIKSVGTRQPGRAARALQFAPDFGCRPDTLLVEPADRTERV